MGFLEAISFQTNKSGLSKFQVLDISAYTMPYKTTSYTTMVIWEKKQVSSTYWIDYLRFLDSNLDWMIIYSF